MPTLRKRNEREASPPKPRGRSHKKKKVAFELDKPIPVPAPCISRSSNAMATPEIAPFSPASTLSPPPPLSPDTLSPPPPLSPDTLPPPNPNHLTFTTTRPASLKPTSNRKNASTGNTHPYTKTYLKRQLDLDEPTWTSLVEQLITAMAADSDLLDSTANLAAQLTELRLVADLKQEDEDNDAEAAAERSFMLYQVALFARRKALMKSGREQMKNIRTEISMMRRTTNTEISAIRADQQVLQEVQTAQGIEQAVLSTRITEVAEAVSSMDAKMQAHDVVNNVVLVELMQSMMEKKQKEKEKENESGG